MSSRAWILLVISALLVLLVAPSVGPNWISPAVLLKAGSDAGNSYTVYRELRLPRALLAFVVGAALAVSGAAFQGMFRNVLASPFTLGVSGGAAVGASITFFYSGTLAVTGIHLSVICALIGALLTALCIWALAFQKRSTAITILLCGVVLSFFYSSVIMLLQYIGDFAEIFRMTHWMLGTLEVVGMHEVLIVLPLAALGAALILADCGALNLLTLGEEVAQSKGVSVRRTELRILLGVSLIVGGVVSVCGPIGFVGIIVPYLCRPFTGYDHRVLLPASMLAGGAFLVICDTASRTLFAPLDLPVGVLTALLGGPLFLWVLLRHAQAIEH